MGNEVAEDYVQYHLGRGFDSLRFYRSVVFQTELLLLFCKEGKLS